MVNLDEMLSFYSQPGLMTDSAEHGDLLDDLPRDVHALCRIVQGLMLHIFWAERYGAKLTPARQEEVQIRRFDAKLARIRALDGRPLTESRPLDRRLVGNCRDFSLLLCAILRHQGVPARARCGFGTYFLPGHFEDHWVCEVWSEDQERWVMVDPQLDDLQCEALGIDFSPVDMPPGRFVSGGAAWQLARSGQADPDSFGIMDMHGLWFIRGDLVRDLLALNKIEILPWDPWGLMAVAEDTAAEDTAAEDTAAEEMALLDEIAALCVGGHEAFPRLRSLLASEQRLRPPPGSLD
jgi:hypothetical protein